MRYFLANWKMFPTLDEARGLVEAVQGGLRERARSGGALPRVIVCPPFVSLAPLREVVDEELVRLGAQDCHWEQQGPYTGEVSARMLAGLVEYVMVGHSERRAAGETDEQAGGKVAAAAEAGLVPILFVGEDDQGQDARREAERRLRQGLSGIDVGRQDVVLVYEPTWAIGGAAAASPEHVHGAVGHLKGVLAELGAGRPEVIYGGSVNEANIDTLVGLDVLDGLGATRASLRPDSFLGLVDRLRTAT
ncbi:MAG TPA: triose-phosphate isomerase family protein [Acidimicrobiales bacterium]|nr:triose-phosphate isomerase family protein [Acidimicrobiales bacterium]